MISAVQTSLGSLFNQHAVLAFNAFQTMCIASQWKGENETPMPYSKFAHKKPQSKKGGGEGEPARVSSRIGMLIIYMPAFVAATAYLGFSSSYCQAGVMCMIHFLKRNLEVVFLHKYSGTVELNVATFIGSFYAFTTFMLCQVSKTNVDPQVLQIGQAIFGIGTTGNFYHHYLLASLRKNGGGATPDKKYHPPKGGFFEYVAAPHYLFELVGWLGIAIASQDLTGFLNLATMTAYLAARSRNQNKWNHKKFDTKEWPLSRKNLVPFIY